MAHGSPLSLRLLPVVLLGVGVKGPFDVEVQRLDDTDPRHHYGRRGCTTAGPH